MLLVISVGSEVGIFKYVYPTVEVGSLEVRRHTPYIYLSCKTRLLMDPEIIIFASVEAHSLYLRVLNVNI